LARRKKIKVPQISGGTGVARRFLRGALAVTLPLIVGVLVALAFGRLGEGLAGAPAYQMSRDCLRLVEGPDWMTPAILAEIDVRQELPERFSLLDPTLCERIARAYEKTVWVERVDRVVKRDPRVTSGRPPLEVSLKFRRPIAFVQMAGRDGFYLVDAQGVRLPGVYREPRLGQTRLLVITGCREPTPQPGRVWQGASLQAGVRVAEAVTPRRERFRLTTVDVSNFGGRRDPRDTEIALYTTGRTQIKWGKAPTPEAAMLQEKSLGAKVGYLDFVYERLGGRIDGVLSYIDIPNEAICRRSSVVRHRLRS